MATTQIKDGFDGGSDNQLKVNSDGSINVDGTFTGTNPSVGSTSDAAPTQATEVGGVNPSGNLKALQVDSSGNLKVTGTLTINEGFGNLSPGYPTQVSVGTLSTQLLPANPNRVYAHIANNSSETIFIQYSSSAALNQGIKLGSGSIFILQSDNLWLGIVNGIGLMANQLIDVLECES